MATDITEAAGPVLERFASSSGRVLGFVAAGAGLLLVVGVLVTGPAADMGLLLFGVVMALLAYVVLIRPIVTAHQNGVVLRNMIRDTFVPWTCIERARVLQTLQLVTDEETYHGFGVSRSRRSISKQQRSPQPTPSGGSGFGPGAIFARGPAGDQSQSGMTYQAYVESRIGDLAEDARKKSRGGQPLVSWAPLPVIGLISAAACLIGIFVV